MWKEFKLLEILKSHIHSYKLGSSALIFGSREWLLKEFLLLLIYMDKSLLKIVESLF